MERRDSLFELETQFIIVEEPSMVSVEDIKRYKSNFGAAKQRKEPKMTNNPVSKLKANSQPWVWNSFLKVCAGRPHRQAAVSGVLK